MRRFIVCIHDGSPAFAAETRVILRDLAPLVGRRLSIAVVPDWHGRWPLTAHPDYCQLIRESSAELLMHGCVHRRQCGRGLVSLLTEGSDEMRGLDDSATRQVIDQGERVFIEAFGEPARGFVAPAWQRGGVRLQIFGALTHILGFFSIDSLTGRRVPLATFTWDCGRWGWLGHLGSGVGGLLHLMGSRTPVVAIHPRDLRRGYWPGILRLTETLLGEGYEPSTPDETLGDRAQRRGLLSEQGRLAVLERTVM